MTSKQRIWVTFQKEGLHKWPDATQHPGVEFLANEHRHMFHFRVDLDVWHDDREVEFILFKRELAGLYNNETLKSSHKSCEMMADELAEYIKLQYPGRDFKIEVSEDGENGCVTEYTRAQPTGEVFQDTQQYQHVDAIAKTGL